MEPTERIAVIRRLILDYGEMMWHSGQGYANHTDTWNTFQHHAESKLDNLAVELTALRAEVTDYKAKAAQFKLAWQGQRDVMRNYEILLTAYQQPPAAALIRDLDGVTDGIQGEELWRAGVKLLRMALQGEK